MRRQEMQMLKRVFVCGGRVSQSWRTIAHRQSSSVSSTASAAIKSLLLRSLKDHYLEVSKMAPPPKVSPPPPFTIVKGALESEGPVLKRTYKDEEISLYAMRLANLIPEGGDDEEDGINQLFVHVNVSKPCQDESLHFLCGLYPDALGIHSVSMHPKIDNSGFMLVPKKYSGPVFGELDERMRDAFHNFVEERGINESLFPFLQAWLYVKDHRNLMRWFRGVATFINEHESKQGA